MISKQIESIEALTDPPGIRMCAAVTRHSRLRNNNK